MQVKTGESTKYPLVRMLGVNSVHALPPSPLHTGVLLSLQVAFQE